MSAGLTHHSPLTAHHSPAHLSRREWLKLATAGVVGYSASGWLETLAADTATNANRRRACILLWMSGGPSQTDTFDLKPGNKNGGPYKEISTRVPGIRISEHLPRLARFTDRMAIVRSMSTREGDHGQATFLMRTGYRPQGPIQYPPLGSLVARELGDDQHPLPSFVSIAPDRFVNTAAYTSGFLGPQYAPLIVGGNALFNRPAGDNVAEQLKVQDLQPPGDVTRSQADARIDLLQMLEQNFAAGHPGISTRSHAAAYDRAVRLMRSAAARAFNIDDEPPALRDAYGRSLFGQGCLLARRLVERGVPFVEVTLNGWDTHNQNFDMVKNLSAVLDPAWAALMDDLKQRGLLDSTLIVWMGEFGRTPQINAQQGRDHFPNAWSTVLAGGGIRGGLAIGRTSPDGMTIQDRPVPVTDFLATVCYALGIDPLKQNRSNVDRPIRIVDKSARPIKEVLTT